ncbi:hypothetical protein BHR79_06360 [Methanohalophilus halophilus]|uniref:Uncharacterized protein n=2 Tax=Methanohalophilus halophilus TaxID=2177 RepID=A0A1L3Q2P0_9EURY|nr:hypothetical protein BHR79_06360 [Methanohalophilus halophilus]RNI09801.1 hypothetical protein EFE40_03895 [Methanohalophilus halophilus]
MTNRENLFDCLERILYWGVDMNDLYCIEEKNHVLRYVNNIPISGRYRTELVRWINTYLDEESVEKHLSSANDAFDLSVKQAAERDLELTILFAKKEDRTNSGIIFLEGELLFLFNLLYEKVKAQKPAA